MYMCTYIYIYTHMHIYIYICIYVSSFPQVPRRTPGRGAGPGDQLLYYTIL